MQAENEEKFTFFEVIKHHYNNPKPLKIIKPGLQTLQLDRILTMEEQINAIDLIDLSSEEQLIVVASDSKIRIYSLVNHDFKQFFLLDIKLNINDDQPYDGQNNYTIKDKKFLKQCRKTFGSEPKEILMHCQFGYFEDTLHIISGGQLGLVYDIAFRQEPECYYLEGHYNIISGLTTNSQYFYSCAKDGLIIKWKGDKQFPLLCFRDKLCPDAECLCVSANNEVVVGAYSDSYIRIWNQSDKESSYWNQVTIWSPSQKLQTPYSDLYPHISQIFVFERTILAKHINGLMDYFLFDEGISIYSQPINDNNYWEKIDAYYPYVGVVVYDQLQIHNLKTQSLTHECDLNQFLQGKQYALKLCKKLIVICTEKKMGFIKY